MAKKKAEADDGAPKSDMDAVRKAIKELGYSAETKDLHAHIQTKFGMNLNNNKISAYKSSLRRAAGIASKRGGHRGGRPPGSGTSTLRIEDVQTVKGLVGRLGADKVRELIAVFHR